MTVFLSSSPCIDGVAPATLNPQNHFLDLLRSKLPKNPRCLFVASSPDDHNATCRFGSEMFGAFAGAGIYFSSYQVLDRYTEEFAAELIHSSDLIILAGGHVPTQNAFFNEIALGTLLQGYQGVILGISAGTMNAAEMVYMQPEEPGESDPDFVRFSPGLGLTQVNVCPHYQKVKNDYLDGKRLFEDITYEDSYNHTFFALPDGSYFYIDEEKTLLFGEAYRIRNGILEQLSNVDCSILALEDIL